MPENGVALWINRNNAIVGVNERWDQFALDNAGDSCHSSKIVGRSLRSFVIGDPARMLVETMISHVRTVKQPIDCTYRCDSPSVKRYMRMQLTVENDLIRFDHEIVRVEPFSPKAHFSAAPSGRGNYAVRCSMCNAVRVKGVWSEPDVARKKGDIEERTLVIYSVCSECHSAVRRRATG